MRSSLLTTALALGVIACGEPTTNTTVPSQPAASATTTATSAATLEAEANEHGSPASTGTDSATPVPSPSASTGRVDPLRSPAIATFLRSWNALRPTLSPDRVAWATEIDKLLRSPRPPLQVRVEKCRDRRAFIKKNFSEIAKLTIAGDLAALDREGDCPTVFVAGGMMREVEFVLDPTASTALFGWIVPEG